MPKQRPKQKNIQDTSLKINQPSEYKIVPELFTDIDAVFSNSFSMTHTGREFILSFLQAKFPIVLSQADMPKSKNIPAKCVSQVVLTPEQMEEILKVMISNFEKYLDTYVRPFIEEQSEQVGEAENNGESESRPDTA